MTTHRRSTAAHIPTLLAAAIALAAGAALAGCGGPAGGTASSGSAPEASATSPAAPVPAGDSGTGEPSGGDSGAKGGGGPATVDATFSGAVSGHFDSPVKGPRYACGTPDFPDLFALDDVEGTVGGSAYTLQVTVNNFTGSGKQTGNVVITLTAGTDTAHSYLTVGRPPTVVMSGSRSGTFEGDAQRGLDSGAPTVHVKGSFRC